MRLLTYGLIALAATALQAHAAQPAGREHCGSEVDAAWHELSAAKAKGLAGAASYTRALGLITAAKTQQIFERYDGCIDKARRARVYIAQSRTGH